MFTAIGSQLTELKKGKYLAIDGDAIEPGDVDSRFLFRNIPSGTGGYRNRCQSAVMIIFIRH